MPDLIQARIDDLVNAQPFDEEITAHIRELDNRLEALRDMAGEAAFEAAGLLAADVQQLCDRIRRDFVAMWNFSDVHIIQDFPNRMDGNGKN